MDVLPRVVDIDHDDPEPDFEAAYKFGIRAVIHKATEGRDLVDRKYAERKPKAIAAGLLWGAYHFMRAGDAATQAQHFLSVVGYAKDTRLILDHEDPHVPMFQALRWLQYIKQVTGQAPALYSGYLIRQQMDGRHTPEFAEYPLWLAEYGPVANIPQPWNRYWLWQFTGDGEGPGPHFIPGIGHKVDVSHFDGDDVALRASWLGDIAA